MEATVIEAEPDSLDRNLVERWRSLAELRENPFLTPEWFSAWLATHRRERPFTILWHSNGELRGVLPLVVSRRWMIRMLTFAGARRGDWFTLACRPGDEQEMSAACIEALWDRRNAWHVLRFDRIDSRSSWPQTLWGGDAPHVIAPTHPRRTDVLPFIRFGEDGYEGYLASRSRNFRSQLGRRRRRLEREHGLTFRMTAAPEQLEADFETFFRLHRERWDTRGGSTSAGDDVRRLHLKFARRALEHGWLRLWIAEADGDPAAAWYGWRIGSRYCYALSGFSQRYEHLAIGSVLLAHTIEQAAAEGVSVYDLMWGDEAYKRRFETGRRQAATWVFGRYRHPVQLAVATRTALEVKVRGAREY